MLFREGYMCRTHADEGTRLPSALLQEGYVFVYIIKTKWGPKLNCLLYFSASICHTASKYMESQCGYIMVRPNTWNETFMTDKDIIFW